jgi:SNF2 family DNA or RNA helicase
LIWEHEPNTQLLEPIALPKVEATLPMPWEEFEALQRATRWGALSPFLPIKGLEGFQDQLFSSPFFGAVQVEEFQLLPLSRALSMSRISLLLADDVGLGKTVEAGLILTELLLRRRVRKVLVITPAALKKQWQQEMQSKFSLTFDVIDRRETDALQKRLGLDANPWRTYPRIITSYHYLKQPDVLEQFRSTFQTPKNSPHLPWDLLIVDEAHNLMPSNFGQDSDLAEMLRIISPWFEHKLFLSATPHNGHTRCFTGLLEQLDPVRFTQSHEIDAKAQDRIGEIVIRRLKREINQFDEANGRHPRFGDRLLEPLPLFFDPRENKLSRAFSEFRVKVKKLIAAQAKTEQLAGSFAVEVLNKRLLSCPYTFALSWQRFQEGANQGESAQTIEVQAAKKALSADLDDDLEVEGRIQSAAKTVGAWLKPLLSELHLEIAEINDVLGALGLSVSAQAVLDDLPNPQVDTRWEKFLQLIKQYLRLGKEWVVDDRLIIFTEYKTTLDYLERRLRAEFKDADARVKVLYGGMEERERESIKQAFNDPEDPIRILVATDAASEGLNLQETARLVLHYDIPWNPARLDQRNGRLDRHGQARDVIVFHFTSEDDADLRFLARVAEKVNTIREDLGSMEDVFDAAFQRRFVDFQGDQAILANLDVAIANHKDRAKIPTQPTDTLALNAIEDCEALKSALDLSPETLKSTLEVALGIGTSRQKLSLDDQGRFHLSVPTPKQWERLVDDYLRRNIGDTIQGALPAVVFDPQHFIHTKNHRPVFRAAKDTVLLHLGHPLFQQALALFARARFPGEQQRASRWLVRYGDVPAGMDGLLLLTVEELRGGQKDRR